MIHSFVPPEFLIMFKYYFKKYLLIKIPCNENAFQRKYVQNHFKESDKLPGLSKTWLKALQRKKVSIRIGAGPWE